MRDGWSKEQVELTVAAYFAIWQRLRSGEKINKAAEYRLLGAQIGRKPDAVGLKFQNISAVLDELGSKEWLPGLAPMPNFQFLLADTVIEWLDADRALIESLLDRTSDQVVVPPAASELREEAPPERDSALVRAVALVAAGQRPRVLDFLELHERNRALGDEGEAVVFEWEQRRLHDTVGRPDLAKRVEWTSKTRGDGAGYDIESFEADGRQRLIEVKTTTRGRCTPFFVSKNELATSHKHSETYQLYRVYDIRDALRFYRLRGPIDQVDAPLRN